MSDTLEGPALELSDDPAQPLFNALLDAERRHGADTEIVEDRDFGAMTYRHLVRASLAFARHLSKTTERGEHVGLFLPTSGPAVIAFFALQAIGRVAVFFNYGQDADTLQQACKTAGVRRVLSSKRFVKAGELQSLEDALGDCAEIEHLEDLRGELSIFEMLSGAVGEALPVFTPEPPEPARPP